jgi:hypothetical protein
MDEDSPDGAPSLPARSPSAPPTSSGTGGKLPAAAPGPSPSSIASGSGPNITSQGVSRRRRGLGVVTPNACTECRKKRAKCDGQRPCSRCAAQKDVECVYEVPVRQSKETLRNEIDHLRRQQRSSEQVLTALARPELVEEVLSRLRGGQSVEAISRWLGVAVPSLGGPGGAGGKVSSPVGFATAGGAGSYGAVAKGSGSVPGTGPGPGPGPTSPTTSQHPQSLRQEPEQHSPWAGPFSSQSQSRVGSWVEGQEESQRFGIQTQVPTPELPEMRVPPGTWTTITADGVLVRHLLSLYFCWEYPTFASLSKEHFLKDFTEGRPRFCSPLLVNALLALGCRFSSKPSTRANPNDPHTSGDHFFKECQRIFYEQQDHHTLTTIQALGIMSIREASCGRDSESWYYAGQSIRLAIEMGLHQLDGDGPDDDETAVQAATFWGAFALDHAWSLATGSLPQCSCFPRLPPKPAIIDDIEASLWIPYTDDGKGISRLASALEGRLSQSEGPPIHPSCEQPSNVRSVYKCFCELSELVHQSLYVLHSPGRPLTSRDLLSIYTQYLNWYDRVPEVLRLGRNFTPAVLFAQ